jgi:hypothetical protein
MSAQKLEWQPLWDAMEAAPDAWIDTTEAMYWQMLEVLPPRAHAGGAFLVGEPLRSNSKGESVYSCFTRIGDNFRARNLTVKQFKEMTA